MNHDERSIVIRLWKHPAGRILLPALIAFAAGFLLGFLPLWDDHRACAAQVAATREQARALRLQTLLGSAVVDATRGGYESSRQLASQFFTQLGQEPGPGETALLEGADPTALQNLSAQRDEVITLLARSDPSSVARLAEIYTAYRQIVEPPERRTTMAR